MTERPLSFHWTWKMLAMLRARERGAVFPGVCPCGVRLPSARFYYCSDCRRAKDRRRLDEWTAALKEARAEIIAGLVCEVCGVPLQAHRTTARFCSARCRQRHHRLTVPKTPL
jgi:hypothetical protein